MPNHITNVIKMEGIANLPLFSHASGKKFFDFNKLIPMPESLNITSGSVEDESIVFYLTEGCRIPLSLLDDRKRQIIRETVCNLFGGQSWAQEVFNRAMGRAQMETDRGAEMLELGKKYVQNFEKHGATTWYDWGIQHWGTKWNAYSFVFRDEDTIQFDTAWSRPEPVIRKLAESYPNIPVEHWWADEDVGSNTGYVLYEDGCEYGGPATNGSAEAYEIYVFCCGEHDCLIQTNGVWSHKDCKTCHGCD